MSTNRPSTSTPWVETRSRSTSKAHFRSGKEEWSVEQVEIKKVYDDPMRPTKARDELQPSPLIPQYPIPKGKKLPDGAEAEPFRWADLSDGSLSLAYTILYKIVGHKRALRARVAFRDEVISELNRYGWTLENKDIKAWLKAWEAIEDFKQQQKIAIEESRPKASAPRALPFWGIQSQIQLAAARNQVKTWIEHAPDLPEAHSAIAYLELAADLAEVRRKTVNSIHWNKARSEDRTQVFLQLLLIEAQITFNIEQFGELWNKTIKQIPLQSVFYPRPSWLTEELDQKLNLTWQQSQWLDLKNSMDAVSAILDDLIERRRKYSPFLERYATDLILGNSAIAQAALPSHVNLKPDDDPPPMPL